MKKPTHKFKPGDKIKIRAIDSTYSEIEIFIREEKKFGTNRIVAAKYNDKEHSYNIKEWHIIPADQDYTKEDYKKAETLSSAQDADYITCPYCGWLHSDSWEYNDSDGEAEEECDSCGKEFTFCVNLTVTYDSFYKD